MGNGRTKGTFQMKSNDSVIIKDKFSWWWVLVLMGCIVALVLLERSLYYGEDTPPSLRSYWPTEIRVDTDMDTFWLHDEERICQTYPNNKGRIAVVACSASKSHNEHNIPVTFWGDPNRNTVSDWKCRREGDAFVCRAID